MEQQEKDPLWESFIANNSVVVDDQGYAFDRAQYEDMLDKKPWMKQEQYFKKCKISLLALVRILQHAKKGGQIEVMGYFRGKIIHDTYVVTDAYPLPVEGTETRVNAGREAEEYAGQFTELCEVVGYFSTPDEEERRSVGLVPFASQLRTLVVRHRCQHPKEYADDRSDGGDRYRPNQNRDLWQS